ncbi:tail fiber protein [Dechloromonas sp. ZY10]|uniref:phage tail protein n=1 Tax=Dechloromonas aquae TaxID=2664436 RepID=UPI003528D93B
MMKSSKKILAVSRQTLLAICATAGTHAALACDGDGEYIGSICVTAAGYCPQGYLEPNGQSLPINGNQALFAVIGIAFGGDGRTNFNLPNLQTRTPVGTNPNTSNGLNIVNLAQQRGAATVTLTQANLPLHSHPANYNPNAVPNSLTVSIPVSAYSAATTVTPTTTYNRLSASTTGPNDAYIWSGTMAEVATVGGVTLNAANNNANIPVSTSGMGQPYANLAPEIGLRYCIANVGIFPPRN